MTLLSSPVCIRFYCINNNTDDDDDGQNWDCIIHTWLFHNIANGKARDECEEQEPDEGTAFPLLW
jgi:hypothetical protein